MYLDEAVLGSTGESKTEQFDSRAGSHGERCATDDRGGGKDALCSGVAEQGFQAASQHISDFADNVVDFSLIGNLLGSHAEHDAGDLGRKGGREMKEGRAVHGVPDKAHRAAHFLPGWLLPGFGRGNYFQGEHGIKDLGQVAGHEITNIRLVHGRARLAIATGRWVAMRAPFSLATPESREQVLRKERGGVRLRAFDLVVSSVHIRFMDFDISSLLADWEYEPGRVVVRRFKAKDGTEKLQLRVDLGLLQMNIEGRPDGKKPFGFISLYEYYQARLYKYLAAHGGNPEGFKLKAEECSKLQLEALQYHHRYICLLEIGDYPLVIRDAERNLAVFDFVAQHAESEELTWSLRQFEPQLRMILTRARGAQALKEDDYGLAVQEVEEGLEKIRACYAASPQPENAENSGELLSLEDWLEEIRAKRPLSRRERLERALSEAVRSENYEKAAEVRDQLRNLKPAD